ncbi:MAG: ATP-binding cassette domain-containing protein [Candidatus Bathyarchaeota archaeon]|nr:ATP-binding cassette domain-containing protein [Candidatus Bathyarchaeota archaeon]
MTTKKEYFRITKHAKTYNHKTGTFTINIAYETATQPTPRTTAVAEAFGLGTDQTQKHVVYDNLQIKIHPTDIIYITGDSGSGKSTLLKTIKKDLGKNAIDTATIKPDPDKPIIETLGKDTSQALELLSKAGLNDAFLFLRQYKELSEGQKYRYKIAKLAETQKQWWIADEFCSTLDRDTAKIVAYNLQKTARQHHKAAIVATTHTDLKQDLAPNTHIHKHFGKEITIKHYPNKPPTQCSLTRQMHIETGTYTDYKKLAAFHYRSSSCPPPRKIFTLKRKKELSGVIVYSYPPPTAFGRSKIWKGNTQELQNEISTISRVILHPKYRTIGLGTKSVKETLLRAETPYVETIAVMAKYNPFFEKAGMQKIAESQPSKNVLKNLEKLQTLGFNLDMLGNLSYNAEKIRQIGKPKLVTTLKELSHREASVRKRLIPSSKLYPDHSEFMEKIATLNEDELAKVLKRLMFMAQTKAYLFWKKA